MSIISKIQKLPEAKKVRIIWAVAAVVVMLLVIVWILAAKWQKNSQKDLRLFETIGKGFKDIKDNYQK